MKIARYIGDLLFEYECIVIPGFGGFITKEVPAKIHPVQNHFIPPSKEIVFNVHLKANDGLLINHIARSEKINYTEAKMRLENFVERCEAALKNGKSVKIFCRFFSPLHFLLWCNNQQSFYSFHRRSP